MLAALWGTAAVLTQTLVWSSTGQQPPPFGIMQSPLIALPLKETKPVDLVKPLKNLIIQNYEQSPVSYMDELQRISQARQDATGQASTESLGRDLLFRYFHIIEMLELRFPELEAPFVWLDSFTHTPIEQRTTAYEKACILYNTAAQITRVSMQLNRSDSSTDALKRAYTGLRQAAGLLQYIKNNFMYAPSDDMKGPALESLSKLLLAQASEVFLEKSIHDTKGEALIAKLASHTAHTYSGLSVEWNDTDNLRVPAMWCRIVACKADHFMSVAHLYRAKADRAAGKHGEALTRFRYALCKAQAASNLTYLDTWSFATYLRSTAPSDVSESLHHLVSTQLTNASEACREAERDNDLVYHERAPELDTLPHIDQVSMATAIPIRDVFSQPDIQKILGGDVLTSLIPLEVLKNTSVYTEEQAKMVRAESTRICEANDRIDEAISALSLPHALDRYAALDGKPIPPCVPSQQVLDICEEVAVSHIISRVERVMESLPKQAPLIEATLSDAMADLDTDARECEHGRVKHAASWSQAPTASVARSLRRDIHAARDALATARENDKGITQLWSDIRDDMALLCQGREAVEHAYSQHARLPPSMDLLDHDFSDPEPARALLHETHAQIHALLSMPQEREAMLQELKRQVQNDDISRSLLLHRCVQHMEETMFAQELRKYAPMQQRIRNHIALQTQRIEALRDSVDRLRTHPGAADVRRRWDASQGGAREWNARLVQAYDAYTDVQRAMNQAQVFYNDMSHTANQLATQAERLLAERRAERSSILMSSDTIPAATTAPRATTLAEDLAALRMSNPSSRGPPPPPRPPRI